MGTCWRLIDDLGTPRSASAQMTADMQLLDDVAEGAPSALRFYRWDPPALSLGRFQPDHDVDRAACATRGTQVVRRPTGGRALLHGGDLTYAVAMPRPPGAAGAVDAVYRGLASALIRGLELLGVHAEIAQHDGDTAAACFGSSRGSDLRVQGQKLVGSAQVHRAGAVLQHGSVMVRRLPFDETDLLAFRSEEQRTCERAHLRARTTTLDELGIAVSLAEVAAALTSGFVQSLDLDLTWKSNREGFIAVGERRR